MRTTTNTKRMALGLLVLPLICLAPQNVWSQDSRYRSDWATPTTDGDTDRLQQFVDELNALVDEAERARAADPVLLQDLRDLARRFDWPWSRLVFLDDFQDGDHTSDLAWSVEGAPVEVDASSGLRSVVSAPKAQQSEAPEKSAEELAVQLFSSILQQRSDPGEARESSRPESPGFSRVATPADLGNAFALTLRLASDAGNTGRLEFGVTQGTGELGYRVAYISGGNSSFELFRIGSRGTAVIDTSQETISLEDDAVHTIEFTRDGDGAMVIRADDRELMRSVDRSFRDRFDGVVIVNRGGGYTIQSIAAHSAD